MPFLPITANEFSEPANDCYFDFIFYSGMVRDAPVRRGMNRSSEMFTGTLNICDEQRVESTRRQGEGVNRQ